MSIGINRRIIGGTFCYHSRDVELHTIASMYEGVQQACLEATEHAHTSFITLRSKYESLHRLENTIPNYAVCKERKITRIVTINNHV